MINHHAAVYVSSDADTVLDQIYLEQANQAEIITKRINTLSIGEVRDLINLAFQTPGDKDYRLLVIVARAIALEAQQALLKILEEPPTTTRFVFILPDVTTLLPTVRSRIFIIDNISPFRESANQSWDYFLSQAVPGRLELIANIAKKKDEEAYNFLLQGLIFCVKNNTLSLTLNQRQSLSEALINLRLRGASKKMIWEDLALLLPIIK